MPNPDFSEIAPSSRYQQQDFLLILEQIQIAKKNGKSIVFASGVFDGLHTEHQNFLKLAKEAGDFLVVALESDLRTRALKGPGRPIHSEQDRLTALKETPYVDAAFILPDDFSSPTRFEEVIWKIHPDIMAVSSHSNHISYKSAVMHKYGGTLQIVHQHNPEISTTQLLATSSPPKA